MDQQLFNHIQNDIWDNFNFFITKDQNRAVRNTKSNIDCKVRFNEDGSGTYTFLMPGVEKEDISVEVSDNKIHITAKVSDQDIFNKEYHSTLEFPSLNAEEVKTSYKNGVLKILIPKDQKKITRKVSIE